jgi:hypothetical protein
LQLVARRPTAPTRSFTSTRSRLNPEKVMHSLRAAVKPGF